MPELLSILNKAVEQPLLVEDFKLLYQKSQALPNSVQYDIRKYEQGANWNANDVGVFEYHFAYEGSKDNYLELKFCITQNAYCNGNCGDGCKKLTGQNHKKENGSINIIGIRFSPAYLTQFGGNKFADSRTNQFLSFMYPESVTYMIPLCSKHRMALEPIFNHKYSDSLENIFINAQIQSLLLYSLECLFVENQENFTCKFLANESDREKIVKAREILLQRIGDPITIKELAKKVATNECYLKKGFKEVFGTTIFDFYQHQRMEHAKYLLYEKGLSVTEVSGLLGYSSISHFSTAFKKQTGLKPCELLLR